jgi:hypothetical protein
VCGVCAGEVDKSWTGSLPSAHDPALGKVFFFFWNFFAEGQLIWHLAKVFFKFLLLK